MPKIHQTAGSNGSRRGRGARVTTTLSEINVVPLVDVMLVLLIIFMVTAPMMQQGMQVNLPQARRATRRNCSTRRERSAARPTSPPECAQRRRT